MPTRRSRRAGAAPALLLALALVTTGCGLLDDPPAEAPGAGATGGVPTEVPLLEDATRLDAEVRVLLDARAAAVRRGDLAATLAQTTADEEVRRDQRRYVRNLARLPLATFRYRAGDAEVGVDGDEVVVAVDLQLRLDGYDSAPVTSPREMLLTTDPRGRLRLASDAPALADPSAGGAQPWDTGPITTRREDGVLGIFDPASATAADTVVGAGVASAAEVGEQVPYPWSGDVVLYAPSDTELLAALADLPGGDPDRLDGVAFAVGSADGSDAVSERVILHPRMLTADAVERDRLLRHELTHVALGDRDDDVPRWLSEGIAEWVSVQPLPVGERLISAAALDTARAGVDDLPADDTFNSGPRSGANYGISWQICEEIAAVYGADAVWTLLEAMGDRADRSPETVLRRVLGVTGPELATSAAERIVAAYG